MTRIKSTTAYRTHTVSDRWELASTAADAAAEPAMLPADISWLNAHVPGTVAEALRRLNLWQLDTPTALHDRDHWYRTQFGGAGKRALRFNGLATLAEVWLNGTHILRSDNMFLAHEVEVDLGTHNTLYICFRSLQRHLEKPTKRARWRPAMITPGTLRYVRTTLLGHMPGWCPPVHAVGPWRSVELLEHTSELRVVQVSTHAALEANGGGKLTIDLKISGSTHRTASVECAGVSAALQVSDGNITGELHIPVVEPWWPHTHGAPALHAVTVRLGNVTIGLGKVGFRHIELDAGANGRGFALLVNGVRIFCRGACWTSADIVALPESRDAYSPWLEKCRDAGMNMIRIGGTMVYEGTAFYERCDELGLLVWQDFMFANFDYPVADEGFAASVRAEAKQFLERTQNSPSLAVLCGGSEVAQQASMLGLAKPTWVGPLFGEWLPEIARSLRPDVTYLPSSPFGGDLPFYANSGATHYYGVGAYMRPLEDARRAEVRFASESLAFANVPEPRTLAASLAVPAVHHPRWKERVPRDHGSSWDFEDVREHYFALLYKLDPARVRRENPERYLELSRAVTGEVMEETFAEWRRQRSSCAGALVWTLQDLWPGAGWGVIDASGEPKSAWYALRRAFRPVQIAMTDEGVNGLALHVSNDRPRALPVVVEFTCFSGAATLVKGQRAVTLAAHSVIELSSAELLGTFFDTTYAYRFGPLAHQLAYATLSDATSGEPLADAFYFPGGRELAPSADEITLRLEQEDGHWYLALQSIRFVLSVHIEDEHYRAADNWFHLAPNVERRVALLPRQPTSQPPDGEVRALNRERVYRFRVAP